MAIDPADPQRVSAGTNWDPVIFQSDDGGQTWIGEGERLREGMGWRAIVFAPSDPQIVYAGTSAFYSAGTFDDRMPAGGIYVSHDGGTTWAPANDATSQDANVTALAVDPTDLQVVYAATGNHGLLKTADGGASWTAINQGLPGSPTALSVALHPADSHTLYAGLERAGLYRSTDGGATWQPSAAGMNPEASVSDIVFDPTDPQVMVAADRFSGVYRSTDGGVSWVSINTGLRTRAVNALAISSDGQHLYAATEGEGVFRLDLNGQPPEAAQPPGGPTAPPEVIQPTAASEQPEEPSVPEPTLEPPSPGPSPEGEPGLPCLGGALPLALVGLVWVRHRRR